MTPAKTTVWPAIVKSLEWLKRQGVIDPARVGGLFTAAQISAAAAGALVDRKMLADLNRELQESAAAGEGRAEWQQRVRKVVTTRAFFEENLHRTLTHRAYHRGIEEIAAEPSISAEFPYRLYAATNDARTRKTHAAMDGKVAHVGSPLAKRMQELADEYGCRCTIILLSREDAVARGIDDNTGWIEPPKEKKKPEKPAKIEPKEKKPKAPKEPKPVATEREIDAELRRLQSLIDQIDPEQERQQVAAAKTIDEKLAAFKAGDRMLEKMQTAAKTSTPLPDWPTNVEINAEIRRAAGVPPGTPDHLIPDYGKWYGVAGATLSASREKVAAERRATMAVRKGADKIDLTNKPATHLYRQIKAAPRPDAEIKVTWLSKSPELEGNLKKAAKWLSSVTNVDLIADVKLLPKGGRAHASPDWLAVYLSPNDTDSTAVHEFGHLFEANAGTVDAAKSFLRKRMASVGKENASEVIRASKEFGDEISHGEFPTNSSYFSSAIKRKYIAKIYPNTTEIISMGIEAMYDDPILFAKEDPEYFKFIYGVLRGAFLTPSKTGTMI